MKKQLYLYLLMLLVISSGYSQTQTPNEVLESLYRLVNEKPKYVLKTIDSIEKTFKGEFEFEKVLYYKTKGQAYLSLLNYGKVYESFSNGVKHAKEQGDLKLEGDFHMYLSEFFSTLEKWGEAKGFSILAIKKYGEIGFAEGVLEAEQSLALIYADQGFYEKSNAILLKDELSYTKLVSSNIYLYGYYYIFRNYLSLNNKKKANEYLFKLKSCGNRVHRDTVNLSAKVNLDHLIKNSNYEFARYFSQNNKLDSTMYYLDKIKKGSSNEDLYSKEIYLEIAMGAYSKLKQFELYELYKDSLIKLQILVNSKQLDLNTSLSDNILVAKNKIVVQEKSNTSLRFFLYTAFLVLITCMCFIVYKKKKHKQAVSRSSEKIKRQHKNQEKTTVQLKSKEKILCDIKQELDTILKIEETKIRRKKTVSLYNNLKLQLSTFKLSNNYEELSFLNPGFFNNLINMQPSLIKSEQIICYYVYMKFKDIEIASLLNLSIRSIESKRYRIRKKMSIKKSSLPLFEAIMRTQ